MILELATALEHAQNEMTYWGNRVNNGEKEHDRKYAYWTGKRDGLSAAIEILEDMLLASKVKVNAAPVKVEDLTKLPF